MLGETLQQAETDTLYFYTSIERAKYLAIISCTILLYDMLLTLPDEVYYVWNSRWSFARFAFHTNRTWGPILLAAYVPIRFMTLNLSALFMYGLSGKEDMDAYRSQFVPNPAPDIISGCTLTTSSIGMSGYVGPFIYETGIFAMTVYKTWKITRTPLIRRLMRDGSKYYFVVICTMLVIGIGSLDPRNRRAVHNSGLSDPVIYEFVGQCPTVYPMPRPCLHTRLGRAHPPMPTIRYISKSPAR
ncbi:hypothetical protein BDV93DRAFT_512573 [Ceratobasidium sp. AG-I]|nr:hypothetical protein BDV93DRAFT_512573 [Ceratobasidium sp. AG-I]